MPTYTYKCEECGEFDAYHSINDKLTECPTCKEKGIISTLVRLISKGSSFILNGSGWAKDNYS